MNEQEITNFAAMIWTMELIDIMAPVKSEADQMIALAASYGPPKNITTD